MTLHTTPSRSLLFAAVTLLACDDTTHDQTQATCPVAHTDLAEFRAGRVYSIAFASPVDSEPTGTQWIGASALAGSPLRHMFDRPVILKGDDLVVPIPAGFRRYLSTLAEHGLSATAGLITAGLLDLNVSETDVACLAGYDPRLMEVWFHGLDHFLGPGTAEFLNTGLEYQRAHFQQGLGAADQILGLKLTTFGAPGNGTDSDTVEALAQLPQITAIFFAPNMSDRLVLPYRVELEVPTKVVRDVDTFIAAYNSELPPDTLPLALQVHPADWTEEDWRRFDGILAFLTDTARLRFTTAQAYVHWQADSAALIMEKVSDTVYRIDTRNLSYDHWVDFGDLALLELREEVR